MFHCKPFISTIVKKVDVTTNDLSIKKITEIHNRSNVLMLSKRNLCMHLNKQQLSSLTEYPKKSIYVVVS